MSLFLTSIFRCECYKRIRDKHSKLCAFEPFLTKASFSLIHIKKSKFKVDWGWACECPHVDHKWCDSLKINWLISLSTTFHWLEMLFNTIHLNLSNILKWHGHKSEERQKCVAPTSKLQFHPITVENFQFHFVTLSIDFDIYSFMKSFSLIVLWRIYIIWARHTMRVHRLLKMSSLFMMFYDIFFCTNQPWRHPKPRISILCNIVIKFVKFMSLGWLREEKQSFSLDISHTNSIAAVCAEDNPFFISFAYQSNWILMFAIAHIHIHMCLWQISSNFLLFF